MAKPTVYMWTDPGAPQVQTGSVTSYKDMFQAVLIDGYGDKLPPGDGLNKWSIPFSDSSSFILKQGGSQARKCCLKLFGKYTSTSTRNGCNMRVHKADDFTDLNTPVGEWESASTNHRVGIGITSNTSYNVPWIIFATERTIICHFGSNDKGTNTPLYDAAQYFGVSNHQWMFGDYKPFDSGMTANQMCAHMNGDAVGDFDRCFAVLNSSGVGGYGTAGDPRAVCRGDHNDELGCYQMVYLYTRALRTSNFYSTGEPNSYALPAYPNKLDGGLYLEPARVYADDAILGIIPGLLYPLHRVPFPNSGIVPVIKGTGDYDGVNIHAFNSRCYDDSSSSYRGQYMIHDGEWGVD